MSDGPHRSLPMRRGWKRVAECADNQAFERDEVSNAIISALEQDCRREISPEFIGNLSAVCGGQEGFLFEKDLGPQLEALRGAASHGIERVVADLGVQIYASGSIGSEIPIKALTDALTDRMARCARQVEEHYCRKSFEPRANRVRARIEEATDRSAIESLGRQILSAESARTERPPLKREGLDDGVKL